RRGRLDTRQGTEWDLATGGIDRNLRARAARGTLATRGTRGAGRDLAAHGGAQIQMLQILQIVLELRFDFQHDPKLVRLREDRRDLTLAKGVIECIVDRLRADAEARGRIAVDDQARLQAPILVVAGDITQLRQLLQLLHKARRPQAQLLWIGIFKAVLILRAADAILDRQVLHWLHEKRDTFYVRQGRLQAADDLHGAGLARVEWLQVDLDA